MCMGRTIERRTLCLNDFASFDSTFFFFVGVAASLQIQEKKPFHIMVKACQHKRQLGFSFMFSPHTHTHTHTSASHCHPLEHQQRGVCACVCACVRGVCACVCMRVTAAEKHTFRQSLDGVACAVQTLRSAAISPGAGPPRARKFLCCLQSWRNSDAAD